MVEWALQENLEFASKASGMLPKLPGLHLD